jgi:hypothetical protein
MIKRKLGEILVDLGLASQSDIDEALSDQSAGESARLGDQLVANKRISAVDLARALSIQHRVPFTKLPVLTRETMGLIPAAFQRMHRLVPLSSAGSTLHVAMADLPNVEAVDALKETWTTVKISVAPGDEIELAQAQLTQAERSSSLDTETLFGDIDLEGQVVEELVADVAPLIEPEPPARAPLLQDYELRTDDDVSDHGDIPPLKTNERVTPTVVANAPHISLPSWLTGGKPSAVLPVVSQAKTPSTIHALGPDESKQAERWTGVLDPFPPSHLVKAVVTALVKRGILSEQDILGELKK